MIKRKRREYTQEDWNVYPWPEPGPGAEYGPTEMQEKLFIYHQEPWNRPHFHGVDVVLMVGGKGSGKCFRKGTPVLCLDGSIVPIEDIQVGDKLLGPDSLPRTVVDLGRGRETFYKVSPVKGEPFYCNESHILTLKRSCFTPEIRINRSGSTYIKPLRYGDAEYVNVSIKEYLTWSKRKKNSYKLYRASGVDFQNDLSLDENLPPYILGAWLGDGSSRNLDITSMDGEIIDTFQEWAESLGFGTRFTDKHTGKAITLHTSKSLDVLRKHNLLLNKYIPLAYKTASRENRLELLAGLIDTDGYLGSNVMEITQKNKGLAEDIAFLCRSLGFAAYLKKVRKSCTYKGEKREGDYYKLSISGDLSLIPTRLRRKQATPRTQIKDVLVTGFTLEKLEEEDYYGVVLEGRDRRFLLGDFTVVHNTLSGIAEIIELTLSFPRCAAIVAGVDMPLLKRNVMDDFGMRLSYTDKMGVTHPWEHPVVLKAPPEKTPVAVLHNGSTIRFLGIDKDQKVRGFTADVFMIEEVNLLSANSLKEMFSRSRGKALKIRQFILNMNPSGRTDWIDDMFGLKMLRKDYKGPKLPHGEVCKCQFCNVCLDRGLGEFEWQGGEKKIGPNGKFYEWTGGECSNPDCPVKLKNIEKGREPKGHLKVNSCPGNQNFYRVIQSASFENPHNPSDFVQLQRGALSAEEFAAYVCGEIIDLNTGLIYKDFSHDNIKEMQFDYSQPLYWTMDFNFDPMCSQVCQLTEEGVNVIDEFTLWNSDELDVAKAFVRKFQGYKGKVYLYGDPNGILVTSRADSSRESFVVIRDYLKLQGFDVEIMMKKVKGATLIPIITRINNLKSMIKTADGTRRIFIDPRCANLIESLRNVKWKESSPSPKEDDTCDKNAVGNPKRAEMPVTMTHPQAALGYFISKEFPLIAQKTGRKFLDSEEKTVMAGPKDKQLTVIHKPKEEPTRASDPKSLASMIPGLSKKSIQERLEYEKMEAEERERVMQQIAREFFGA